MKLADQIEEIARQATARIVDASHRYSATQDRLAGELEHHQVEHADPDDRLRVRLEAQAEIADTATPRIMLPADRAEASPHRRPVAE